MTCKIEGCDLPVIGWEMCSKHYYRWKRNQGKQCKSKGCSGPSEIHGFCEPCYNSGARKIKPSCTFPGCNKPQVAKGLCQACYMRQRESGSTERKYDGRTKHPLYRTWEAILKRCNYPSSGNYKHYGAKGIKVCERWTNDFWAFVSDMGDKPTPAHTIERISSKGDYEPSNCCWATQSEQSRNKSVTRLNPDIVRQIKARARRGERCSDIARSIGASYQTVRSAIDGKSWKDIEPTIYD